MSKRNIVGWKIVVDWDDGTEEDISDMPDDVAGAVDQWLSELEDERNEGISRKNMD